MVFVVCVMFGWIYQDLIGVNDESVYVWIDMMECEYGRYVVDVFV